MDRIDDVAVAATTQIGDQGLTIGRSAALLAGFSTVGASAGPETGGEPACDGKSIQARVIAVRYKPLSEASAVVEELLGPCGAVRVPKTSRLLTVEDEPERLDRIARALGWLGLLGLILVGRRRAEAR